MCPSSVHTHPISTRELQILPKAYDKSERLDLDFWDPCRLAAHVLATLSPADQREKAADLILEMQITGSFLARYTRQIGELLDGEDECELIRAIARTVSKTFWVPSHEPRAFDCYNTLQEIAKDLRRGASCVEDGSPPAAGGSAAASCAFETEEGNDAEEFLFHKLIEEASADLADERIGIEEHQVDNNAGCRGDRELGGGTSSAGGTNHDRDHDDTDYYDLRSLLEKISLAICHDLRYSATGIFWDYTTHVFGLSRRGEAETGHTND